MEYQRNLPDARMVNTPTGLWISKLLRPRADLLHNRRVLRSQLVVRNGFSRLLLGHGLTGNKLPRTNGRRLAPENFVIKRSSAELRWLRIQSVNRELALTLTVGSLVYVTLSSEHALAVKKPRQSRRGSTLP
jgi:hypothetical protein